MRIPVLTLFVLLLLVCADCGVDNLYGLPLGQDKDFNIEFQDGDGCVTWIDGHSANRKLRTLKIRKQTRVRPGDDGGELVRVTVPAGFTVDVPLDGWTVSPDGRVIEGELKVGEALCVPLNFADLPPDQPAQELSVRLESFINETPILQDLVLLHFPSRPSQMTNAAYEMLTEYAATRIRRRVVVRHDDVRCSDPARSGR